MPKVLYIINEAHGQFNHTGTVLSHTYCNADQCVDHLAYLGAEQNEELVIVVDIEFVIRDHSLNLRQVID